MRYSTFEEEEEYNRVVLPQEQLSNDRNETTMDTKESENNNLLGKDSVVSNLPLLFANGHPTSLEKITLVQLERFVTFMVQCSLGRDTTEGVNQPQWWPTEIKFSNPLIRPKRANDWMEKLKKLVFRCYTYHRNEYLLRFCSYLVRYPQQELEYVSNWDSTTSLYHKSSGKLLVTFRNENMTYDKGHERSLKKLLSCSKSISSHSNKPKHQHSITMVEPPTEDIYLCDNCDGEFIGLAKMKEHERVCYEKDQSGSNSRPATPDLNDKPELKQNQFLGYFELCSKESQSKSIEANSNNLVNNNNNNNDNNNHVNRTSRRVRGSINFTRCTAIPFSSPAGIFLGKKSKAMTKETQLERLERIERHLVAPVLNNNSPRPKWLDAEIDNDRWIVTYKPNQAKSECDYVHQYRFLNSVERKPMLSIQSQLLYVVCRPVYILLTRMTEEQINDVKQNAMKCGCLVQDTISIDYKETMTEDKRKPRPNISSKRKAPSDENDKNTMEKNKQAIDNEISIKKSTVFNTENPCDESNTSDDKSTKETLLSAKSSKDQILLIDLCSSDEEEVTVLSVSTVKSRDSIVRISENVTMSLVQNPSSTNNELDSKHRVCLSES